MAIFGVFGGLHRQQVTIHDARVSHRHAAYFEQIVGTALEQAVFDVISLVDVFERQDGRARSHPADEWQRQLGKPLQRQRKLFEAGFVDGPKRFAFETNAPGGAADQFDHAFSSQGLQMFFSSVG